MIWLALAAAVLTWGLTAAYIKVMTARGSLDQPNHRSMHDKPKPTGAGVVAIPVILALWWMSSPVAGDLNRALVPCTLILCLVGWIDDVYRMPASTRLVAYLAVVGIYLALLPQSARVVPFLPIVVERALLLVAWAWYVNLFNFMDGIDGIAGSEAVSIGIGFVVVAGIAAPGSSLALLIAAAMLGYLMWNWAPGSVMMGDAGSIPLGFLTGALMLELAVSGHLAAALILPAYFCIDATVTLVRRLRNGHRFHESHREHFYQRAAAAAPSHATVVLAMLVANAGLVAAAVLSGLQIVLGLGAAALVMAGFFMWLSQLARTKLPA
jgi:UDP-N-acetylmuramyl pentapeptide phosphotransferase/UDP-N-acetylglucosamine-1-phosphate transferase